MTSQREFTGGMATVVASPTYKPLVFVLAEFNAGTLYLWNGRGQLLWNSITWNGAGTLMSISPIKETADLQATGVQIGLAGLSSSLLSTSIGQARLGKKAQVWFGSMNMSTGAVEANPYLAFEGRFDTNSIALNADTCIISCSYENHLVSLDTPKTRRWTNEDQQISHPGDLGFIYIPELINQVALW